MNTTLDSESHRGQIVQRLQQRLDALPLLPVVVLKLLQLDPADGTHFEQVSELIAQDPPFAVRVLTIANSAAMACGHGSKKGITTLRDALMRVGAQGAVDIVVCHSATRVFLPRTDWERSLWSHALSVGLLAQRLSRYMGPPRVDPAFAYLAGLLHDLGRFILYLEAPADLRAVDETEWDTPTALIDAEKAICGLTHTELGFLAAQKWRLPEDLSLVIRSHHACHPGPPEVPAHLVPLVSLVRAADWLSTILCKRDWEHLDDRDLGQIVASQVGHLFREDAAHLVPENPRGAPAGGFDSTRPRDRIVSEPLDTTTHNLRLLLVDDDPTVIRAYGGALARHGVTVETASNGKEAAERVKGASFDVILTDIAMPEMTGIEFLKAVRAYDLDVPVILMTGEPSLDSAVRAVEYGAFRYLAKPVAANELWQTVLLAARLHRMAALKRAALELPGWGGRRLGDRAALEVRFSWGMDLMWMAFQPIVGWGGKRVFGYEALLRSDEPLMKNPADMLDAAERLDRVHELGRAVRGLVAAAAPSAPEGAKLLVNLHSTDLNDEELYSPEAPLSKIASRVVLEVTERASLHAVRDLAGSVAKLKALGFQIAIDDLGTGYAGLASFTQLDPQIAKLDVSLVSGVETDPRRQSIIRSMARLCDELGMLIIAEGVETAQARDALAELGCDLLQGYLFAKPERGFNPPRW